MDTSLYLDGTYLDLHPNWHVEDSLWKASKVLQILERNSLHVETIAEVGCGAGEVLASLQRSLPPTCTFRGYEISPAAYQMCCTRANEGLSFFMQIDSSSLNEKADIVLALDVLEHTEDYFSFLRLLRDQAQYCILHVPLDLSLQSLLCGLPQRVRKTAGHLHYFTAPILASAVRECGFEIVDMMYTRPAIERTPASLLGKVARYPRLAMAALSERVAALTLGGFSMIMLAKRK